MSSQGAIAFALSSLYTIVLYSSCQLQYKTIIMKSIKIQEYKKRNMLMEVVRQVRVNAPDLSAQIKAAREADGRSVQVLATAAGISSAYWYQIEKNQRHWISEKTLRGIESALDINLGVNFDD